ncbi:hypothetical protein MHBO_000313 [Bonamia ostreae]|uniref:Uncharacterized protein n=1 Tax=Bonamia ostreae TaxID=126728 RepID=A0ABV2AF66_9EUKA
MCSINVEKNIKYVKTPEKTIINKDTILVYDPFRDDFVPQKSNDTHKFSDSKKEKHSTKIDKKDLDKVDSTKKDYGKIDKKEVKTEKKKTFHFKDFLGQYGSIDGLMTEIINNDKFQEIALFIRQYPFIRNILKLLFDIGLGGMRAGGCSRCSSGSFQGGDSFASRRFEKGKTNLKKEDFEQLLYALDKLKDVVESDPELLNFATRFEKDPWSSIQLVFKPQILQRIFEALELEKYYGKNKYTGMKRTFNDIMREIEID